LGWSEKFFGIGFSISNKILFRANLYLESSSILYREWDFIRESQIKTKPNSIFRIQISMMFLGTSSIAHKRVNRIAEQGNFDVALPLRL